MSDKATLSDSELLYFSEDLVNTWRDDKKNDEEQYKKFTSLSKGDLRKLIDYLIEEIEDIKGVNKLIRLRESLNTIFDLKLLYNNLKITIQNNY